MLSVLAIALAPVFFIFMSIYLRDRQGREPFIPVFISFLLGGIAIVPAIFMEVGLEKWVGPQNGTIAIDVAVYAFFVVAFSEEILKFIGLRLFAFPRKVFDEPYDGIVYAVAVSLGFAAVENVLYVLNYGMEVGWLRMFTSVPGHAMFGVLMGFYVGRAKFSKTRFGSMLNQFFGIFLAVAAHGLYDFFLMWRQEYVALLAFVVLIVGIILAIRAMNIHRHFQHAVTSFKDHAAG